MKIDDLEALVAEMYLQDVLIGPADVTLSVGMGDVFPVPDCRGCEGRCCAQRLDLKLFDIARFMDNGLDEFIQGTFESYMEHTRSVLDGGPGVKQPFPYIAPPAESTYCRFLNEDHVCSIYEVRMCSCRTFPLAVVGDKDGNVSIQWFGDQCKIVSDEISFWRLVDNAVQNWNEGVITRILLMNARDQLRELGFGKYLGDERRYMINDE